MRSLLSMVGLPELPLVSLVLIVTMIVLAVLLFGWISDMLLGDNGFGILFNTGIILVGGFVGAWLWHRFGFPTRFDPNALRAAIAVASGLGLLVFTAIFRI
ncbi:conserved membrane hypothetical protein [Hyphomicrobiales bacterium]|nr:conserved membrane hypothetical protein [Hyphomicrobiales bacterium]CAH1700386.1 conserved membrane hypothetical protein [Hyphomicrobiales bacterium]CAI0344267.1 conserved membrane hypothetical protein [Hyphomicrobiales bacterium]